jgi:acyl-CoA thioesterase I
LGDPVGGIFTTGRNLWLMAAFAALVLSTTHAPAEEKRCSRARSAVTLDETLPNLRQKVEAGESIKIVAIGSSSTEGTPDLAQGAVYPSVLGRELSKSLLTPVEIINKGKGGETIPTMLARFDKDVIAQKPDLVIWQLGVNDVLRFKDMAPILKGMKDGLATLRAQNIPVVLMDLQVGAMVENAKDTPVMQAAIEAEAAADGVMVFGRYKLLHTLLDTGTAREAELIQADGLHMTKFAHLCTGTLLAQTISQASMLPKPIKMVASKAVALLSAPTSSLPAPFGE